MLIIMILLVVIVLYNLSSPGQSWNVAPDSKYALLSVQSQLKVQLKFTTKQ
jgi:hypothetical protein